MPQCLFCLREGEPDTVLFTDEHVFPAALGGNLIVKDGSCDVCNHGNSKFEQALAGELLSIRMLLQIPDRYGKVPQTAATIITPEKTYDGRVKGDGSVVVKPLVTEEKDEKGEREFVHRFLTDAQKEKLREQAKKEGKQLIEMGRGDPVTAEVHVGGELMVIGSQEGLRTVAKIAYAGLARLVGVRVAAGDAFNEVRQFILDGEPEGVARLFTNKSYLEACQQGPHQHSIAIAARRDKHRVDAIARLFGELTYFVVLSVTMTARISATRSFTTPTAARSMECSSPMNRRNCCRPRMSPQARKRYGATWRASAETSARSSNGQCTKNA
jgi:hypothetical protein